MTKSKPNPDVDAASKTRLSLTSAADLARESTEPDWLIKDVMVAGQPMVIGGPAKSLKTSLALDLAVSLGSGTKFLGTFVVPRGCDVAVFSGESGRAAVGETLQRICQAKGVKPSACRVHFGFRLPRLGGADDRKELRQRLREYGVRVVVIDPLYLCLTAGGEAVSAANLYEVGAVLAATAEACLRAGATPVLLHHTTKAVASRQGGAVTLNDLAFSGVGEFARQWLLVGRTAEYRPGSGRHELALSIGGSAGHSSLWRLTVDEGQSGRKRRWDVAVQPDDGRGDERVQARARPNSFGRQAEL